MQLARFAADLSAACLCAGSTLAAGTLDKIKGIYDLSGKTVVTTRGATSEQFFEELNREQTLRAKLVLAKDHTESFCSAATGQSDAFVMDDVLLYICAPRQSSRRTMSSP
jgi:glutamate/aspartate transport system substrate-binding protein